MDDRTIITELSNMTLPVFIRKFNSMPLDERINLLKNPYLDELNEVIFSSLFLQVQNMEEVRELLDNKKIFHKVLTSPKNKKKRNILNIIGEDNFPLLKYIFESNYILDYKEQFLDYIDSIDYEQFKNILENIDLTKLNNLFFKEYSLEELEDIIGISSVNKDISSSFFQKVKMNILNPLGVLKIKNEKELLLYTKFNLLINVLDEPKVGAVVTETFDVKSDEKVSFNFKDRESGSSGGLMLTLTIYSHLNEIDLTGGKTIVGTGTIDINGNVGEISGIKYKLIGAVNKGADVFLVPVGENYEDAKKLKEERNYDIELVPVATFEEALKYLENQ